MRMPLFLIALKRLNQMPKPKACLGAHPRWPRGPWRLGHLYYGRSHAGILRNTRLDLARDARNPPDAHLGLEAQKIVAIVVREPHESVALLLKHAFKAGLDLRLEGLHITHFCLHFLALQDGHFGLPLA